MRFFDALPAYYGSKRKLVKAIFKVAPSAAEAPVFADAFLGAGSVSLMAKALGYQVHANDIAERSYIVGRALIENNRARITDADVARLFVEVDHEAFIEKHFCPEVFLTRHARFLDNALEVVRRMEEGPKKYLLLLLLVKFIFSLREFNKFSTPNAFNLPMEAGEIEKIKQRTYKAGIKNALKPIPEAVREMARIVNRGVIDNARENYAYRWDVREFLGRMQADVVYLDPPYAGTMAYEESYHVLDEILAGERFAATKSEFSRRDGIKFPAEVLDAAGHIPDWIVSMGTAGGTVDVSELCNMVRARRKQTEVFAIKYSHIPAVASAEHQAKNQEYLIVGRGRS